MGKLFGYLISVIGIVGIVLYTFPEVAALSGVPANLIGTPFLIASVVIAFIGVFLAVKGGGGKQPKEVPIYRGKHIVGYRQHK